jgi:phospholipase/lecithinase/hemolysin
MLRLFDVHDWVARVLADPGAFGFSYGLTAGPAAGCLFPPLSCPDLTGEFDTAGQGRFFWDELHPTTQVHRLLADEAFAALGGVQPVPEPPAATIFVLALAGLALTLRGIGRTARRGAG